MLAWPKKVHCGALWMAEQNEEHDCTKEQFRSECCLLVGGSVTFHAGQSFRIIRLTMIFLIRHLISMYGMKSIYPNDSFIVPIHGQRNEQQRSANGLIVRLFLLPTDCGHHHRHSRSPSPSFNVWPKMAGYLMHQWKSENGSKENKPHDYECLKWSVS